MRLYELTGKYAELQELMEAGDGEAVSDTLESLEGAIEEKVESIHRVYRNIQSDIDALKAEEKRLSEKRKALENEQKRLKEYTESQLNMAEIDALKTGIGTVGFRKSPASIEILDESAFREVHPDLVKFELKVDKAGLKDRIKQANGGKLPPGKAYGAGFAFYNDKRTLQFR